MKTYHNIKSLPQIAGLVMMTALTVEANDSPDFIEQIDLHHGTISHNWLSGTTDEGSHSGTETAMDAIGIAGATFALYAKGLAPDDTVYLLDEATVEAYTPRANINITSQDPHPTTRTRADVPFDVDISVTGLKSPSQTDHESALNVYVKQLSKKYDPVTNIQAALPEGSESDAEILIDDFFIIQDTLSVDPNVDPPQIDITTKITNADPYKQRGEVIFRAFALPDADLGWRQIASDNVQVWPVADVEIQGINMNQRITRTLPNLTIEMVDLYPDSTTSVQIYKGTAALGQAGSQIEGSSVSFNAATPQNAQVLVANWDSYALDDGIYTIEVITMTPFNNREPERLAWVSFEVDRTIELNGSTTTSE